MAGLDDIFFPSSVAIVGASAEANSGTNMILLDPLLRYGFRGTIYPVNPKADEIKGLKSYPSLLDIPGPVDLVICALAARHMPRIAQECAQKGAKGLHIFSAGFSESGETEGKRLEAEVVALARQAGVRVIGPNCFGVSCLSSGLSTLNDIPTEPGSLALASQSSAIAVEFTDAAAMRGVRFSKAVCYGNGADLNETDFLEYYGQDPDTRIITLYLEGVRDKRFFSVLRDVAARKPVLILKGGTSGAGGRAVSSHTGSLVGRGEVWWALCRQAGALAATSFNDLVDLAVAFYHFTPPVGDRTAIVVFGGGTGVKAADDCERGGLIVPPLDAATRQAIGSFMPPVGTSTANPVDGSPGVIWVAGPLFKVLAALDTSPQVDLAMVYLWVPSHTHRANPEIVDDQADAIAHAHRELRIQVVGINSFTGSPEAAETSLRTLQKCVEAGVPVFSNFYSAASAVRRFIDYHSHTKGPMKEAL
ncbi:MAG: CoA-binding protein [Dehalococcoidia bacterium]|jgi:acyl-CoA synthetase (NDP forming)|nr:CoA-binding protein [Dehalococcoidia bacterium]